MIKSNDSTEFEDGNVSFINLSNKDGLEKLAIYSEVEDFLRKLKPIPNRSYIHVNMLGSSEIYGPTKNGDFFSTATLEKFHKTFQTTPAKFFKHHQNKAHSPSFGVVVFATFNPVMKRIELVVEVDEPTSLELDGLMKKGIYPKTSMACKLPYDRCSICGNVAKTRQDYCKHLMFEMGKMYPDGRRVYAINEDNITWFDCSWVARPADPTSSILTKVAENMPVMGSIMRAELEGFSEKKATLKKWSDLIKDISDGGEIIGPTTHILENTQDLPLSLVEVLSNYDLNQSLAAMASLGISPSIDFLSELITRIHLGSGYHGIGCLVEEYIKNIPDDTLVPAVNIQDSLSPLDPKLVSILAPYVYGSSLLTPYVEKRASGVGYAHLGPYLEPTYQEEQEAATAAQPQTNNFSLSYGKLLLGIGASALLAKYFISREIDKRMREDEAQRNQQLSQNYVKIGLMKRADYKVASSLSKAAMLSYTLQKDKGDSGINGLSMAKKLLKSAEARIGDKLSVMLVGVGLKSK